MGVDSGKTNGRLFRFHILHQDFVDEFEVFLGAGFGCELDDGGDDGGGFETEDKLREQRVDDFVESCWGGPICVLIEVVGETLLETVYYVGPKVFRVCCSLLEFLEEMNCIIQYDSIVRGHHRLELGTQRFNGEVPEESPGTCS